MTDADAFRSQYPVFERVSYLNAGTEGPISTRAADAARERVELELTGGRCGPTYFKSLMGLATELRTGYGRLLHSDPIDVALTGSTTDGCNTVLSGLDLRKGDEVLTTDEEHPGLLAPLGRARKRSGITVRVVPFNEIASEVRPTTRLVACSHVSWVGGKVIDAGALKATGVPFLLDAAQGIGAVPVDVQGLGCDFYAASGQKWLSGPEGSGCLYVKRDRLDELLPPWPGYGSVAKETDPLDLEPADNAARLDLGFPPGLRSAWALASMAVLADAGWDWVHDRAATLAASLADQLSDRGLDVAPRGRSTLVSWLAEDPQAEVERLAAAGFVVRSIPSHQLVRASVGAWSSAEELERLVAAAAE
jgi:L-cysteine/cystine lyase